MRGANGRGHDCLLVEEATVNYFSEFKRSTLDMIRAQGAIVALDCGVGILGNGPKRYAGIWVNPVAFLEMP